MPAPKPLPENESPLSKAAARWLMAEKSLGWNPTRVRDLTGRGYREQLRGFCRPVEATPRHS
jgi:hypothetical protein